MGSIGSANNAPDGALRFDSRHEVKTRANGAAGLMVAHIVIAALAAIAIIVGIVGVNGGLGMSPLAGYVTLYLGIGFCVEGVLGAVASACGG